DAEAMKAVLGNLAGAMFTFVVFVCSSLLLVVQLASALLTPRIIGVLLRDPVTKLTLSAFVFTFAFAISALLRLQDSVPMLTARIGGYGCGVCLALFLFLVDRVGKLLRPNGALHSIASQAHRVIKNVYPRRMSEPSATSSQTIDNISTMKPTRTLVSVASGVV